MPKVPTRYIPKKLTRRDKKQQRKELRKSRAAYKKGKYHTRKNVLSFKSKVSPHVLKAQRIYGVDKISASSKLAKKTGCSRSVLQKIVKKGQGAYFSSGSRPNQTGHSWGRARLASSITGGKAAAVDYNMLKEGCKSGSRALRMANASRKKHGYGTKKVKSVQLGGKNKTVKRYGVPVTEKIVSIKKSTMPEKKYTAVVRDLSTRSERTLHFGHSDYEQFKDSTGKGHYSSRNHGDERRKRNYFNRHSGIKNKKGAVMKEFRASGGKCTPKILSHIYLW